MCVRACLHMCMCVCVGVVSAMRVGVLECAHAFVLVRFACRDVQGGGLPAVNHIWYAVCCSASTHTCTGRARPSLPPLQRTARARAHTRMLISEHVPRAV